MECMQSGNILEIREVVKEISKAMSKVAAQDERLNGMDDKHREQDQALNLLFERVRNHDLILGKDGEAINLKIKSEVTTELKPFIRILELMNTKVFFCVVLALLGMILVGALCDIAYHNDLIKVVWNLVPREK